MTTYYLNPFTPMRNEMERLFGYMNSTESCGALSQQLPVNIWEEGENLAVEVEAPGVKQEQVEVSVSGDELTIRVERPEPTAEGLVFHRRERPVGVFSRTLRLPFDANAEKVEAELADGVLTLRIPKAEAAKRVAIKVK